jgi:hypothetical protein
MLQEVLMSEHCRFETFKLKFWKLGQRFYNCYILASHLHLSVELEEE